MKRRYALVALALLGTLNIPAAFTSTVALQQERAQAAEGNRPNRIGISFVATETAGSLFENVVAVLKGKYYDERFRAESLPELASRYSEKASRAKNLREQRETVQEFLSRIPASHLGLLSKQTFRCVLYDLQGRAYPTFGFHVVEVKKKFYAVTLLEGGPGERAGLLAWDRVVSIDGVLVEQSARLDWRSDDAYITDERDPPVHRLVADEGETIRLKIERRPGKFLDLTIAAENYSAFAAAKSSARIYKEGDRSFGYLHFWFVHITGVPELLKEKFEGEFSSCDGLILDLRGRGGNGAAISKIIEVLRTDISTKRRPIVALIDRQSRSAKDVLAYEMKKAALARLVGEPTAGAVIPASFADVGHETVLMFPSFKLPRYTDLLEFKPVEPDVFVERAGPLSAGSDPILKAGLAEALKLVKTSRRQTIAKSL